MKNSQGSKNQQVYVDSEVAFNPDRLIQKLFSLTRFWPIIFISVIIGVLVAFVYNRYSPNIYEIETIVSVEEVENPLASATSSLNLGLNIGSNNIVETRLAVLKSQEHNFRVIKRLGWEVEYSVDGRLSKIESYPNTKYIVEFDRSHPQLLNTDFKLEFRENGVVVRIETSNYEGYVYNYNDFLQKYVQLPDQLMSLSLESPYNEWIFTDYFKFRVVIGDGNIQTLSGDPNKYSFQFKSHTDLVNWGVRNIKGSRCSQPVDSSQRTAGRVSSQR